MDGEGRARTGLAAHLGVSGFQQPMEKREVLGPEGGVGVGRLAEQLAVGVQEGVWCTKGQGGGGCHTRRGSGVGGGARGGRAGGRLWCRRGAGGMRSIHSGRRAWFALQGVGKRVRVRGRPGGGEVDRRSGPSIASGGCGVDRTDMEARTALVRGRLVLGLG
jgi:hypothetical protein